MSRERRPYLPLDVEDTVIQRGSLRPRKERRPSASFADQYPTCVSLLGYLPSSLTSCLDDSLQAAYEELEEQFNELESRYSVLHDTLKQEREVRAAEMKSATSETAALKQKLLEADTKGASLRQELAKCQEQSQAAETELADVTAKLASAQKNAAVAEESLRRARDEAQQLTSELKTEQEEHAATRDHLTAAEAETKALNDTVQASTQAASRLKQQLSNTESKASQLSSELAQRATEHRGLLSQLQASKANSEGLDREISVQQQDLSALRAELDKLKGELSAEKEKSSGLSVKLEEARADWVAHQETSRGLEKELEAIKSELVVERAGSSSLRVEIEGLTAQLGESAALKKQLEVLGRDLSVKNDESCSLRAALATQQEKDGQHLKLLGELRAELAAEKEESSNLGATLQEYSNKEEGSGLELQQLRAVLQAKEEECGSLQHQLQELTADLQSVSEQLARAEQNLTESEQQMGVVFGETQAAKSGLAVAQREASAAQEMLKVSKEETASLGAELAAVHEEGSQLAEDLHSAEARIAQLELQLAAAATQNGHEENCASSSAPDSRAESETTRGDSSPPFKAQSSLWDSAAEIQRPTDTDASTDSPIAPPERCSLHEGFRDRREWQQVWEEGSSAGWLATPNQVERGEVLGKGSFGTTFLGSFRGQQAAVKCVRIEQESHCRTFVREIGALAKLRHPNIVRLLGAVVQPPQACWLVVEYLPGGTLAEWLYGRNGRGVARRSVQEKLTMAIGIAKGMLALHSAEPQVMHRDLKPSNVLLTADGLPKISDFGLCREHLEDEAYTYTAETGSYTYMSPEMMRGDIYGPSTDIYSFGILLTEIMKQRLPFEEFYLTPMQIAEGVAYNDLRPQLPSGLPGGLKPLIEACWDAEPEGRPPFDMIVPHLGDILGSVPQRRGLFS